MSKEIESLIKKFNQGSLADFTELELYIESGEIKLEELTGLDKYYNKIEQIPVPEASPRLKPNFYKMLAKEQSKGLNWNFFSGLNTWIESWGWSQSTIRLAYASFILIFGIGIGIMLSGQDEEKLTSLTEEVQSLKELMLINMLNEPSATERLKAVNLTSEISEADSKVIKALIATLINDENVNVRFAALEALYNYSDNPEARKGLVDAIKYQHSPMIQVALAEVMVSLQEKSSIEDLKHLLENHNLDEGIKEKLNESIERII